MLTPVLGLLAITLYLAAAGRVAMAHRASTHIERPVRVQVYSIAIVAVLLHATLLYQDTVTIEGLNLGVFNAASLIAWIVAVLLMSLSITRPLESLAVVLLPVAAFAVGLALLFPTTRILSEDAPQGLVVHVALSVAAYSLFSIANIQALALAIAEYKLQHHHPVMNFLPPLHTMEGTLFQITGIAFVLLTLSLLLAVVYTEDVVGQHLVHKIFFSVLSWIVFAVLLWGRWRFGWRGARAVRYVVGGSILLAVAYFGTKIVLELIL